MIDIKVGSRIQSLRKAQGLTQKDLAKLSGCSYGSIQKYEQSIARIPAARVRRIAAALGTNTAELLEINEVSAYYIDSFGGSDFVTNTEGFFDYSIDEDMYNEAAAMLTRETEFDAEQEYINAIKNDLSYLTAEQETAVREIIRVFKYINAHQFDQDHGATLPDQTEPEHD